MANHAPGRLTRKAGMRFAFTLAGGFLVIAGLAWWRGGSLLPTLLASTGIALLLAGMIVPTQLAPVERAWMRFGELLSRVTAPIFLSIVYFLVLTPVALIRRGLGRNTLSRSRTAESYWFRRDDPGTAEDRRLRMERQF